MRPSIDLDDRQIEIQLERMRRAADGQGALPAMRAIARYGKTSTQLRFRDQKGPDGKRWIPSEPALERGGQTLRKTNRLFRSITGRATPGEALCFSSPFSTAERASPAWRFNFGTR